MIDAVTTNAAKLNIKGERIRVEHFANRIKSDSKPVLLELRRSAKQLEVAANQSLLNAMLEAGIPASFSCKAGNCKSCAVKVLDGDPEHLDSALSEAERNDGQLMCPCVSRAKGNHLVLDI